MELYVIAGPNGAGKTTFAHEFLPKYTDCKNFVNADLIAQAMAPFSPETAAFRAGRMMLDEMHTFASRRVSFAFETTLSGKGYLSFLHRLKAEGYQAHIFFLSLTSVELALSRVESEFCAVDMTFQRRSFDDASIVNAKLFGVLSSARE
jgi:predicted ABC-type ATPase